VTAASLSLTSCSPADTRAPARILAAHLAPGDVVALTGELGSGKTEFVRGLAEGLNVPDTEAVTSPTFALVHEYFGRLTLVHLDLYRLEGLPLDLLPDLEDYFSGPHVTAVEWPNGPRPSCPRPSGSPPEHNRRGGAHPDLHLPRPPESEGIGGSCPGTFRAPLDHETSGFADALPLAGQRRGGTGRTPREIAQAGSLRTK